MFGAPLPRSGKWKPEILGGIEIKQADNFFLQGDTSLPGTEVEVVQFRGDWIGERTFDATILELHGMLVASPGEITARNGDDDFAAFRSGAVSTYLYGRLESTWQNKSDDGWAWKLRGAAQLASGALLPTEQLALGGSATVRGYAERILLADSGYALSAELMTPAWTPRRAPSQTGSVRGVAFLEHGLGWREGEGAETLIGAGFGVRLGIGPFAEGRLDVASASSTARRCAPCSR
jgi:hemolysin activation/secretion protein